MIFILVPVHNRLHHLRSFVRDLDAQVNPPSFRLVVIDAGSTDGTGEFLHSVGARGGVEFRIDRVAGETNWWWSQSILMGLERIKSEMTSTDKVLIINDDVSIGTSYLQRISKLSDDHPHALISSCLVASDEDPCTPFHFGVSIDTAHLAFEDIVPAGSDACDALISSDVASGRGTLFPAAAILAGVKPRTRKLPHYLADYDMAVQARALGYTIVGRRDIYVTTDRVQGNSRRFKNRLQYRTRTESPGRLLNSWNFWTSPMLGIGRITVLARAVKRAMKSGV